MHFPLKGFEYMKIKAYAKINISLDIVGKRESDGYHLLKMIMQNIDLYDEISIEKQKEGITISCNKNYCKKYSSISRISWGKYRCRSGFKTYE